MDIPKTASQIQYEKMVAEMRRRLFMQHPAYEDEAIVRHYISLATLAMQTAKAIEMRNLYATGMSKESENIEHFIRHNINEIKRHHLHDFGIKLEWYLNSPNKGI